ncbi:Transcriptional regulator TetR family [Bradyrhizobium sp.]|nr:Transcriptional regulator TetR family [Bradyrhizobium sp.]
MPVAKARDDNDQSHDRRSRILEGARAAFLRFGFQRASMADIAAGAGVSRTALYHYFPGKEEVLVAVVDELHARSLSEATKVLEASKTLDAALIGVIDAKFGRTLAAITESPHGVELEDATHRLTGEATRAAHNAFHRIVVKALGRYGRSKDADAVADTLIAAAKGLMRSGGDKHVTKSKFDARLRRLVAWVSD